MTKISEFGSSKHSREVLPDQATATAVPEEATQRVRQVAQREGWRLQLLDAGEFGDADYLRNPYDRCFHCMKNLYASLASLGPGIIVSGNNLDDLDDYRPGLLAAAQYGVRHPFVECEVDKASIRRIARHLGYQELAALPASPCLSSRIETGLPILAGQLGFVHRVERRLREALGPEVVRCRIRPTEIAIQLDDGSLRRLNGDQATWLRMIAEMAADQGLPSLVRFEPYRMGSAFVAAS